MSAALLLTLLLDVITLTDGRLWIGEVLEEEADRIKVKLPRGAVWLERARVAKIETEEELRAQRRERTEAAKSAEDHRALAGWCRDRGLAAEEREEWEAVIRLDAGAEDAHRALGHVQVDGEWMTEDEAAAARGMVRRGDEWVTPEAAAVLDLLERLDTDDAVERAEARREFRESGDEGRAALEKWHREAAARLAAALAKDAAVLEKLEERAKAVRGPLIGLVTDEKRFPSPSAPDEAMTKMRAAVAELRRIGEDPAGSWVAMHDGPARDAKRMRLADGLLNRGDAAAEAFAAFRERAGDEAVFRRIDAWKAHRANVDGQNAAFPMSDDERALLRETNAYRLRCCRGPLLWDEKLAAAAKQHSEEMERLGYFSHTSPVGEYATLTRRTEKVKFKSKVIGENLARGEDPPEGIMQAFQDSPGHHRNLLVEGYTRVGIAKKGEYWTVDFGGDPE
jgi:hypothetical protein